MMYTSTRCVARSLIAIAATLALASAASAQTFTNNTAITIPAGAPGTTNGPASVYPSIINVAGVPNIDYIEVRLLGLTHTYVGDLDILIVAPGGQAILLASDQGNNVPLTAQDVIFTFDAPTFFPTPDPTGVPGYVFRPVGGSQTDPFTAPAPAGPYTGTLNALNGSAGNGTWALYIMDDAAADVGALAGGWQISFNGSRVDQPRPEVMTYQGRLDFNGTPANGNFDIQYNLWTHPTSTLDDDLVSGTPTVSNVPVANGLFSIQLDGLATELFDRELWLEIRARQSGGGAFTPLAGRQKLTASPFAISSANAFNAAHVPFTGITANPISLDASGDLITTNRLAVGGNGADLLNGNTHFQVNGAAAANGYGGMYLNTSDAGSWPFYGYATNNAIQMWTYYNGTEDDWRVWHGADRLFLESNGYLGIGVNNPANRLELPNLASADGRARANAWLTYSSEKFKTNITPIASALERLERLQGVTFDWKPEHGGQHDIGFIAQRVAEVLPEVVAFENGEPSAVDYSRITALAVEAVKELKAKQDAKVDSLVKENADLKARLERIEALLKDRE
ncbi:MAG: tail fiber domain-containing protein [Phycisphaerales bacterium]|nr:MAG: tail fiber domain-containing protein [Phycisphaerales bacterium]